VVERTGNVPPRLLHILSGPSAGDVFPVRRQVTTIGRALDNDVVLTDAEVSRHHARIEYRNGAFEVVDLGSTNGTSVNGLPISRAQLQDGDVVSFGTAQLELVPYAAGAH
jgi:pSer/pThr/pTyr-binding forkhead associated (FHA) protein